MGFTCLEQDCIYTDFPNPYKKVILLSLATLVAIPSCPSLLSYSPIVKY